MSEQGKHAGTISIKKNALEIGIGTPLVLIRTTFYYDGETFRFIRGGEVLTAKVHGQSVCRSGMVAKILSISRA